MRTSVRVPQAPRLSPLQSKPFCSTSSKGTMKSSSIDESERLFAITYLENVFGFTPERAMSASKYSNFKTSEKPDAVISFLKSHGFTTTQICGLARRFPPVLLCHPEKILLPKIEFFLSLGLSNKDITAMLSAEPTIFRRSLEKQIVPSFEFIKGILKSQEKALSSLRRSCGTLIVDAVIRNTGCLKEAGVPESNIAALLTYQPRKFITNPIRFRNIVGEVKDMGFNPLKSKFVIALQAFSSMSKPTWDKKVEIYKKWGFSENEILEAFRKHPFCMTASEDKIMGIMELLVHKLGVEPSVVMKRPKLATFSLQSRLIPRSIMYQALSEKGLIPESFGLINFFEAPEKMFLRRFVERFEAEAPELLTLYREVLPCSP